MPTVESVAIREENAIARIQEAVVTLKARTGADFSGVDLGVPMAPMERQAVTLEQLAEILESLVVVLQEPVVINRRAGNAEGEEADDGTTDESKRRPSPRRKTEIPGE